VIHENKLYLTQSNVHCFVHSNTSCEYLIAFTFNYYSDATLDNLLCSLC